MSARGASGDLCRDLEITLSCDEAAFEGSGVFLLGSVLERFFARYVAINSFTEMVLETEQGEIRPQTDPVALFSTLGRELFGFDFFQALRWLESRHPQHPRLGNNPVRLGQEPATAFAPATIVGLEAGTGGRPPRLLAHFLGLLGPNDPLPLHLTDICPGLSAQCRRPHVFPLSGCLQPPDAEPIQP